MPLFRKKPVVIEAIKWTGENADEVQAFLHNDHNHAAHGWVKGRHVEIGTLEGLMVASIGDWIIKGVKDEFYPCKPDIFEQTYEPVEADRKRRGEPVGWQPIETAPKDGTTILVWFKQHGAMTVCWGDRDYDHTSEYAIWLVDDHKHGPYPVRGYSRGDDTHWMPLPSAPQPAEPSPAQIRRAKLRADPAKAAALDRARERIAAELANSAEPVKVPSDLPVTEQEEEEWKRMEKRQ